MVSYVLFILTPYPCLINDKIWIQQDGIEDGIVDDFLRAGIPNSDIVLAFYPSDIRKFTEFAVS